MALNLSPLVHQIIEDYALPWHGTHGVGHWARVLENGMRLAEATGANLDVVRLFAVFHDSRRINEVVDFGHGQRGAELAAELRGDLFDLSDADFTLLYEACAHHTDGLTEGDITIQTCWDADRLDLGRVGMMPEPKKLCTDAAKMWEMIRWADGRAAFEVVPEMVKEVWGIELGGVRRVCSPSIDLRTFPTNTAMLRNDNYAERLHRDSRKLCFNWHVAIGDNAVIPYVTWNDYYSVGDPSLDAQHKQIIGIINELFEAMQKGDDRSALKPLLDRLLQYTLAHFTHEEQVLKEHEYPDWVQHAASHDKIRQRTRELREHAHLVTGDDMLRFLKEWWVGHIQALDKKYMPYLELSGSHR